MIYFGLLFALPGPTGSPHGSHGSTPRGSPGRSARSFEGSRAHGSRVEVAELPGGNGHFQIGNGLQASSSLRRDSAARDLPSVELPMTKEQFFAKIDGIYTNIHMPEIQRQNLLAEFFTHTKASEFNQRLLSELQPGQLKDFPKDLSKDLAFKEHPELYLAALGSKSTIDPIYKDMLMDIVRSITPETQMSARIENPLVELFYRYKRGSEHYGHLYNILLDLHPSQLKKLINFDFKSDLNGLVTISNAIRVAYALRFPSTTSNPKKEIFNEYIKDLSLGNPTGLSLKGEQSVKEIFLSESTPFNRKILESMPLQVYSSLSKLDLSKDINLSELLNKLNDRNVQQLVRARFTEFRSELNVKQRQEMYDASKRQEDSLAALRTENKDLMSKIIESMTKLTKIETRVGAIEPVAYLTLLFIIVTLIVVSEKL